MARVRLRLAGLLCVLALAAAACGGERAVDDGSQGRAEHVGASSTKAVELRAGLTYLLVEEVDLVARAAGRAADGPALAGANRALDDNAAELSRILSDSPTTQALLRSASARRHAALLAHAASRHAHDGVAAAAAVAGLDGELTAFADLVHASADSVGLGELTAELRGASSGQLAAVDAAVAHAPDAPALLAVASARARRTSALLAAGLAAHLRFGATTGPAAELRAGLTALLVDHVYGVAAVITSGGGQRAAVGALDAGSVALTQLLAGAHPEARAPLLATWREHIDFFHRYAVAGQRDRSAATAARRGLDGDRRSFGASVHQAVPTLPAETVATELISHVATMLTALDALAAGDPEALLALRAAAGPMPGVAAVLAGGITEDRQLR